MGDIITPPEFSVAIAAAEGEIGAILAKYGLRFTVIQIIIDGIPQPLEVKLVPEHGMVRGT